MEFITAGSAQNASFDIFESNHKSFLEKVQDLILEAIDKGHVSAKVNFYTPENKDFSKEHRHTLVSYLQHNGFKSEYLNNEVSIYWGNFS